MKYFKVFIVAVLMLIICAFIGMNDFVFSEEMKREPDFEVNREVWSSIIASNVNSQKIKMHINNRVIDDIHLYMNDAGDIMFPAKMVVDEFDCGMRMYDSEKQLIIQRNDILVTWHLEENRITINHENNVKEQDTKLYIEMKEDEMYLPLEFLVEGLACQYMWIPETNTLNVFDLFSEKAYPEAFYYKDMDKVNYHALVPNYLKLPQAMENR